MTVKKMTRMLICSLNAQARAHARKPSVWWKELSEDRTSSRPQRLKAPLPSIRTVLCCLSIPCPHVLGPLLSPRLLFICYHTGQISKLPVRLPAVKNLVVHYLQVLPPRCSSLLGEDSTGVYVVKVPTNL